MAGVLLSAHHKCSRNQEVCSGLAQCLLVLVTSVTLPVMQQTSQSIQSWVHLLPLYALCGAGELSTAGPSGLAACHGPYKAFIPH
jgi:hypothetical protein